MKIKQKDVKITIKLSMDELGIILESLDSTIRNKYEKNFNEDFFNDVVEIKKDIAKIYNNAVDYKEGKENSKEDWYEDYKKEEFKDDWLYIKSLCSY